MTSTYYTKSATDQGSCNTRWWREGTLTSNIAFRRHCIILCRLYGTWRNSCPSVKHTLKYCLYLECTKTSSSLACQVKQEIRGLSHKIRSYLEPQKSEATLCSTIAVLTVENYISQWDDINTQVVVRVENSFYGKTLWSVLHILQHRQSLPHSHTHLQKESLFVTSFLFFPLLLRLNNASFK